MRQSSPAPNTSAKRHKTIQAYGGERSTGPSACAPKPATLVMAPDRNADNFASQNTCATWNILIEARRWLITGQVQGVGFRPFVYRLAQALGIHGYARNLCGKVEIVGEGPVTRLDAFARALIRQAPPLARPDIASVRQSPVSGHDYFSILPSRDDGATDRHVPADYFCCDACLRELHNPRDRRFHYPFVNCTQCGPRYTLIERLPYDRANTAMAAFALCPDCRAEYENPADRRFHAEPVACPSCGPSLQFRQQGQVDINDIAAALTACIAALRAGGIVAVKGIGGYHLMVDATNEVAVKRLRQRKVRPHKPLAVMFPCHDSLLALHAAIRSDSLAESILTGPARPIVLAQKRVGAPLATAVAPELGEIGVMLPYSPLHHLLLTEFGGPLVATSANISGEPVLTDNVECETRLAAIADAFLHHNRPILRPADDPVYRVISGKARPIRLGRGATPLEIALPCAVDKPLLAMGGHMKNTIALAWGQRVVVSPHIGDLASPRSMRIFAATISDLQALYGVRAAGVVCDAHPNYGATRWAAASKLPVTQVFHHHAHASALAGEHPDVARWLMFTWDGMGYGEDGTLWGGEALLGRPGQWQRVGTMRPFRLPGGDKAGREPWRSAAALCWESGLPWRQDSLSLAYQAWHKRINTPQTSAVGRLFDAAAALVGLLDEASFEGQGPLWLEAIAGRETAILLPLAQNAAGLWQTDWAPLLPLLLDRGLSATKRAGIFHASLALALSRQARAVRDQMGNITVGLGGGVFQNRLLTETALELLQRDGFDVRIAEQIPCNDAGLSFGQIIEAAGRTS